MLPRLRSRPPAFLALLIASCFVPAAYGQMSDQYRQAAQLYRQQAASASGADRACYMAYANYHDALANNLQNGGGYVPPAPTCTIGGGGGASGPSENSGSVSSAYVPGYAGPAGSEGQQVADLMMAGFSLLDQLFSGRRERQEEEERLRREQEERETERQRQIANEAREREIREMEERIAAKKRKEQELNDAACQLLIQSRALLGQTVDLGGDNACSRLMDAMMDELSVYRPGGRPVPRRPSPETVIDGSKVPKVIDFNDPRPSPLEQLVNHTAPPQPATASNPSGRTAMDRLLDSLSPDPSTGNAQRDAYPKELIDKLNRLLDARIVPAPAKKQ